MIEETKYDLNDPKSMMSPFEQMTIVMEKVFIQNRHHSVSIQELWEQINKIKNSLNMSKTKDGIPLNSDRSRNADQIAYQNDADSKGSAENTKNGSITLDSEKYDGMIEKLMETINEQNKRLEKIEGRVTFISNRAEDKFDQYDSDINKLVKARIDDCENICRNLEVKLDAFIDQQKQTEYSIRDDLKTRISELDVSIRTIKRNLMGMGQPRTSAEDATDLNEKSPMNKTGTLFGAQKNQEDGSVKDGDKDIHGSDKSAHADSNRQRISNFNQGNMGNPGFEMIFDEIDKLRNKFDDFVHVDDFDEMGNVIDDLQLKIAQIAKQGGYKIELPEEMDEFSQSEDASPIDIKSEKGSQINENNELINEEPSSKSIKKAISLINDNVTDNDTLKEKPNSPTNATPFIKEVQSNNPSSSKIKSKDLSPSKKSYYNPMSKRSSKGSTSKTIIEVRKIVEKWPKLEEAIEELKESEKLNFKNIYKFGENLQDFKKEFNDVIKKKTDSLYNTISDNMKAVEKQIQDLLNSEEFRPTIQKVKTLQLQVEKLFLQFEAVRDKTKELERILKEVQEIANSPFGNMIGGEHNGVDEGVFNELKESVSDVKKNLSKLKQDVYKSINEQEAKLITKVDEEVVNDLEEALHQGIDQVMTSSSKKFADKKDVNKTIRILERNMKNMYDLFINKDEVGGDTEDAMLARKHFGFTCMSCEKNLVNLEGKKAEFNPWSKLPVRDPADRMVRVGHGFSKMLSQLKPDLIKTTEVKEFRPTSGRNLSLDPDIGRNNELNNQASSSLNDFNKVVDESQNVSSIKLSKSSKIKLSKKVGEHLTKDAAQISNPQNSLKNTMLPKIESSKNL